MSLAALLDKNKTLVKKKVKGGLTEGHVLPVNKDSQNCDFEQDIKKTPSYNYVKEYNDEDTRRYFEATFGCANTTSSDPEQKESLLSKMETLSVGTSIANHRDLDKEQNSNIYSNYQFIPNDVELDLNVCRKKNEILKMIKTNPVLIIKGATGCGKTTQIPQFILESCAKENVRCNIIVTQPRRIAAISVAKRVCDERNWELGTIVGYQVGLDKKVSEDTRLLYCTTGVLLQKLISAKTMCEYTHIILDEIHERDEEMDFTLLVVRKLFRMNSPMVKIILMSATMDTSRFANYFSVYINPVTLSPAVVYDIGKKHNYDVHAFYLNDLDPIGGKRLIPEMEFSKPGISDKVFTLSVQLIEQFNSLDSLDNNSYRGSVLVFLPGIREIEVLYEKLKESEEESEEQKYWLCPLHSSITADEQLKVFHHPPPGVRKIILSTNIAESSITVPDIEYVVDFCLTKHLIYDDETNFSHLQVTWASKNNCEQRAGRTGRVNSGRVYRLVSTDFYSRFSQEQKPVLLSSPLTRVVLKTKILGFDSPTATLALALDPPDHYKIQQTVLVLKQLGAMLLTTNGCFVPDDGDITYIGRIMAHLPVDVQVSKLIILGHMFDVLEEAIIMGCAMSVKSIFREPFQEQLQIYNSKLTWADSTCSDLVAYLNAYQVWRKQTFEGKFESSKNREKEFGLRYYIEIKALKELSKLEIDIKSRLKDFLIEAFPSSEKRAWSDKEKPLILKIAIAGAFYPNYFVRNARVGQIDEREAVRILENRDPFSTVYLKNMPQPAECYAKQVRKALFPCARDLRLSTNGANKLFVEFPNIGPKAARPVGDIPGKIAMAVYRAVKLKQLNKPITIHTLNPATTNQLSQRKKKTLFSNLGSESEESTTEDNVTSNVNLPGGKTIEITITYVENPGRFWAMQHTFTEVTRVQRLLRLTTANYLEPLKELPKIGGMVVAPYRDLNQLRYYRARVTSILEDNIAVYFCDFGNSQIVHSSDLRMISNLSELERKEFEKEKDAAFECTLAEIQPAMVMNPNGEWCHEATKIICNLRSSCLAEIYSIVNDVVSLKLFSNNMGDININKLLISKGYAENAEESYLSKEDHDNRDRNDSGERIPGTKQKQTKFLDDTTQQVEATEAKYSTRLIGPYSPLEMNVYPTTKNGSGKLVVINWSSVNSVLLDGDPQDPHERLLVAGNVGINEAGNQLNLRNTTLLPNIHGLSAILSMLFAPRVELRRNDRKSKLIGALCGLGTDNEGVPLFPGNDMEVVFDCEFSIKDIQLINKVRFWMNTRVCSTSRVSIDEMTPMDVIYCQQNITKSLLDLLREPRGSQGVYFNPKPYQWNLIDKSEMICPVTKKCDFIEPVFDLVWGVPFEDDPNEIKELLIHIMWLHSLSTCGSTVQNINCDLCQLNFKNVVLLKIHMETSYHKNLERKIFKKAEEYNVEI
uniref:Probable ATP-dependent RNA helicase spindle-E n=1 Tax=Clastoptera arizonana TaxID=38151 RepID=A0A1B6DS36_9HEMI